MKDKIEFAEFLDIQSKLEIKVGEIKTITDVPKSDKLIKLEVDFGEDQFRTVVTNIKPSLGEDYVSTLTGRRLLFVTNLKPVKMMGIESTAMIMPGFYDDWAGRLSLSTINSKPGLSIL
jgi:methionyl-tRNA synthetase